MRAAAAFAIICCAITSLMPRLPCRRHDYAMIRYYARAIISPYAGAGFSTAPRQPALSFRRADIAAAMPLR